MTNRRVRASVIARTIAVKKYGHLYHVADIDRDICSYCGDKRQALDHVPPISMLSDIDVDIFRDNGGQLLLYPTCEECNMKLSGRRLTTYAARVAWLWEAYAKMIDKRKSMWCKDDIDELGPGLKPYIEGHQAKTNELMRKLRGVEKSLLNIKNKK